MRLETVAMTTFTLTVNGPNPQSVTETTTVTVTAAPSAQIASFTASTQRSPYGGDVALRWRVTNPGDSRNRGRPGRGGHHA